MRFLWRLTRLLIVLIVIAIAVVSLWAWKGRLLENSLEQRASAFLGLKVSVGRLDLDLPGRVELHEVTIPSASSGRIARLPRVPIELSLMDRDVRRVTLERAELCAHETEDGIELVDLLFGERPPIETPEIVLERCSLSFTGTGPVHRLLSPWMSLYAARLEIDFLRIGERGPEGMTARGSVKTWFGQTIEIEVEIDPNGALRRARLTIPKGSPLRLDSSCAFLGEKLRGHVQGQQLSGEISGSIELDFCSAQGLRWSADLFSPVLQCTPSPFPCPLKIENATLSGTPARLEIACPRVSHGDLTAELSATVEGIPECWSLDLSVKSVPGQLDDSLRSALCSLPGVEEVFTALEPAGQGAIDLRIRSGRDQRPRFDLVLDVVRASLSYRGFMDDRGMRRGFPLDIEDIQGRLSINSDEVSFNHLLGFTRTGGWVLGSGRIGVRRHHVLLKIDGRNIEADADFLTAVRELVEPSLEEWIEKLNPSGRADYEVRVDSSQEGDELQIRVLPDSLRLQTETMPIGVLCRAGALCVRAEKLSFERLEACSETTAGMPAGSLPMLVEVDGDVQLEEGGPFRLNVRTHRLALDQNLRSVLSSVVPDGVHWFDDLSPEGRVDVDLEFSRDKPGAPRVLEIFVEPKDVRLRARSPKLFVEGIFGEVSFRKTDGQAGHVEVTMQKPLTARILGCRAALHGHSVIGRSGQWTAIAEQVPFDEELFLTLGSISPFLEESIRNLGPQGFFRLRAEVNQREGEWAPSRIFVSPDRFPAMPSPPRVAERQSWRNGVLIRTPFLPTPIEWTGGDMQFNARNRVLTFDRLEGQYGDAALQLRDGVMRFAEEGNQLELTASLLGLPVKLGLLTALPAGSRELVESLDLSGNVAVEVHSLRIRSFPDQPTPRTLNAEFDVTLNQCGFTSKKSLRDLTGQLRSSVHLDLTEEGRNRLSWQADLKNAACRVGRIPLDSISAVLKIQNDKMTIGDFEAHYAGGKLPKDENWATITLKESFPYQGFLSLKGADLSRIGRGESVETEKWNGRLDASCGFQGMGSDLTSLQAEGQVSVTNANLWDIPLFDRLYKLGISHLLGQRKPPTFEEGHMRFRMRRGTVQLRELKLEGAPLRMVGGGLLGPESLDVNVYPEVKVGLPIIGNLDRIPVIGWVIRKILNLVGSQTLAFRMKGPYSDPAVLWNPVSVLPDNVGGDLDRPRLSSRDIDLPTGRF